MASLRVGQFRVPGLLGLRDPNRSGVRLVEGVACVAAPAATPSLCWSFVWVWVWFRLVVHELGWFGAMLGAASAISRAEWRFVALDLVEEAACRPKTCKAPARDAQKAGVAKRLADASRRPP